MGSKLDAEIMSPVSAFTPQMLVVASLAAAIIIMIALVLLTRRNSAARGDVILLVGLPDAGKTAIMTTLTYKQTLPTHTSMQANSVVVPLGDKSCRVIDIPGHPRIRDQFREYIPSARGIVFVVDSSTVSRNGPAAAEHLHQVMHAITSLPPSKATPSLLILAHKCDLLKSTAQATPAQLAINRARTILERELEKRRASQTSGVGIEGLGAEGSEIDLGGLECTGTGEFRFADWEGGEVAFAGTSVAVGQAASVSDYADDKAVESDGLSSLCQWLEDQL
ncbi:nucleoside triphosphate hydrolase protein [Wolfiporia cocos MD-104 SS10]|uniref:Signal recognition particle receptor subunit beta n=1 Tax=Wolfiporia cocos (strain MD-104) TaxID=742152 RepID=A0A2H3J7D0_WOLCO|nr:nucleoside triphosphate hydrolase protein [Wolfiporia cocos MD-104 SS10]